MFCNSMICKLVPFKPAPQVRLLSVFIIISEIQKVVIQHVQKSFLFSTFCVEIIMFKRCP